MKSVVIIDYGMGNTHSIISAIEFLGFETELSSKPSVILNSHAIVLPGVGSFYRAMQEINQRGLKKILHEAVYGEKIPLLGICLGMQLLAQQGTEDGYSEGLGFIDGTVERLPVANEKYKIPHVGFATTTIVKDSKLFEGFNKEADFYYSHSYRMICPLKYVIATAYNGIIFTTVIEAGNVYGTQFHPELSQTNGLKLLKNFLKR